MVIFHYYNIVSLTLIVKFITLTYFSQDALYSIESDSETKETTVKPKIINVEIVKPVRRRRLSDSLDEEELTKRRKMAERGAAAYSMTHEEMMREYDDCLNYYSPSSTPNFRTEDASIVKNDNFKQYSSTSSTPIPSIGNEVEIRSDNIGQSRELSPFMNLLKCDENNKNSEGNVNNSDGRAEEISHIEGFLKDLKSSSNKRHVDVNHLINVLENDEKSSVKGQIITENEKDGYGDDKEKFNKIVSNILNSGQNLVFHKDVKSSKEDDKNIERNDKNVRIMESGEKVVGNIKTYDTDAKIMESGEKVVGIIEGSERDVGIIESGEEDVTNIERYNPDVEMMESGETEVGNIERHDKDVRIVESGVKEDGIMESGEKDDGLMESGVKDDGIMESGGKDDGNIQSYDQGVGRMECHENESVIENIGCEEKEKIGTTQKDMKVSNNDVAVVKSNKKVTEKIKERNDLEKRSI